MPAKVVTIAQQKGGAGKTTIAAQLAVAFAAKGLKVGLVDIDPQRSLAMWFDVRRQLRAEDGAGVSLVEGAGWRLTTELDRLRRAVDLIIVDSPPHAETDVRIAVRAADLILVPMQPSPMDLWATQPTMDMAVKEKSAALMVLNRTPAKGKLVDAVRRKVAATDMPVAATVLGNRVAFAASMMEGKGVVETNPRHTATKEINALAAEIAATLGLE